MTQSTITPSDFEPGLHKGLKTQAISLSYLHGHRDTSQKNKNPSTVQYATNTSNIKITNHTTPPYQQTGGQNNKSRIMIGPSETDLSKATKNILYYIKKPYSTLIKHVQYWSINNFHNNAFLSANSQPPQTTDKIQQQYKIYKKY